MSHNIPSELASAINQRVIGYLQDKSAHGDVVEALQISVKPLGDVRIFCPNRQSDRYVIASTKGVVFACAMGMNTIGVRLDERMKSRALASGGRQFAEAGDAWAAFTLFRNDWSEPDLKFWARKGYEAARR